MRVLTILVFIALGTAWSAAAETKPTTQPSGDTYKVKKGTLKLEVQTDSTLSALERIGAGTICALLKFIGRCSDGQKHSRLSTLLIF